MSGPEFLKAVWPKLVEATGDPLAPMVLQEAYAANERLGKMLASAKANPQLVEDYANLLLAWMKDAESEGQAAKPEFAIALAALLNQALIAYVSQFR